jgi:hypothetical protein
MDTRNDTSSLIIQPRGGDTSAFANVAAAQPCRVQPKQFHLESWILGHQRLTTLSRASRGRESESLLHPARLPEEPGQRPPTIGPRLAPGEPRLEVWWLKKTRRRAMVSAAVPSVVGKPRSYPDLTKLVMIPSRFELGDASSERTGLHEKGFQGRDLLFGLSGCRSWQWGLSGLP